MSLALLLTSLVEYTADCLVNDCAMPEPKRMLSYHGRMPQDDCCDVLTAHWDDGRASVKFPGSAANADNPCGGMPVYTIHLRYTRCWTIPEGTDHGIEVEDATWNHDALMLADVADCVARSLIRLACSGADDEIGKAVLDQSRDGWLRYVGATPIVPLGGCAGVEWSLHAAVRQGPAIS